MGLSRTIYMAWENLKQRKIHSFANIFINAISVLIFYWFLTIRTNINMEGIEGASTIDRTLKLGTLLLFIIILVFKIYVNNGILKGRYKEIGLYDAWGFTKPRIYYMLFIERLITGILSLVIGLFLGLISQGLLGQIFIRLLPFANRISNKVDPNNLLITTLSFLILDIFIYLKNVISIHSLSTITLLHAEEMGDQSSSLNWKDKLQGLLGFALLLGVYYMVQHTKSLGSLEWLLFSLVALFIASYLILYNFITLLIHGLKRSKTLYYRESLFPVIAKLGHSIRQNAKILTIICFLLTGIIIGFSTTISLYQGAERQVEDAYLMDSLLVFHDKAERNEVKDLAQSIAISQGLEVTDSLTYTLFFDSVAYDPNSKSFTSVEKASNLFINLLTNDDFNDLEKESYHLENNELLAINLPGVQKGDTLNLFGQEFIVKDSLDSFSLIEHNKASVIEDSYLVMSDLENLIAIAELISEEEAVELLNYLELSTTGSQNQKAAFNQSLKAQSDDWESLSYYSHKADIRVEVFSSNSAYLLIVGSISIILITYIIFTMIYRQVKSARDNQKNIEIQRKLGMSERGTRRFVLAENSILYILPLLLALLHVAALFNLVCDFLVLFTLTDTDLIKSNLILTALIVALMYFAIYLITYLVYQKDYSRRASNCLDAAS